MYHEIKEELLACREERYAAFAATLLPGEFHILGVRLPRLRKIAKRIARGDWRSYLKNAPDDSFEEIMLQGMVIGCAKAEVEELLTYIAAFVPKINNWSVCDSFCIGLAFTRENKEKVWKFLQPYLSSKQEFEVRFALVMLLDFYAESDTYAVLHAVEQVRHEGYYAKMAAAWAVSVCFTASEELTMEFLRHNALDDFTYHKALQKITESLKVKRETKDVIRSMKRRREGV